MEQWQQRWLRGIPPVNEVLETRAAKKLRPRYSREMVARAVAETLEGLRRRIQTAREEADLASWSLDPEVLGDRTAYALAQRLAPRLRRVINATGVVLHTNLGRSPLAPAAVEQVRAVAERYSNLELDLGTGERGSRYAHVEGILLRLTGAEAALVVNNNAGAVLLALAAVAKGREVVVSRGELVEIGGAFRVPEVMEQSGCTLVEVGTTNKTRLSDYERALGEQTGALLKVHTSNYRIIGFTEEVPLGGLARLGRARGVPLIADVGSGALVDLSRFGLAHEPTVQELLVDGADLVTFSGDKLLGGPQAGVVVGRRDLVERCRRHPLTRALRIDKLTLAALEATLKLYLDPDGVQETVPALRMLSAGPAQLEPLARRLAARLRRTLGERARVEVIHGFSQAGGGSLPGENLPTRLVAVAPVTLSPDLVEQRLRQAEPPVMARLQRDQVLFDVRTLTAGELPLVAAALDAACRP